MLRGEGLSDSASARQGTERKSWVMGCKLTGNNSEAVKLSEFLKCSSKPDCIEEGARLSSVQ